jgi:hypothetical protein
MGDASIPHTNLVRAGLNNMRDIYSNVRSIYRSFPDDEESPLQHPRYLKMFDDIACLDIEMESSIRDAVLCIKENAQKLQLHGIEVNYELETSETAAGGAGHQQATMSKEDVCNALMQGNYNVRDKVAAQIWTTGHKVVPDRFSSVRPQIGFLGASPLLEVILADESMQLFKNVVTLIRTIRDTYTAISHQTAHIAIKSREFDRSAASGFGNIDQNPKVSLLALALTKDLQALEQLCIDIKTHRATIQAALEQIGLNEGHMETGMDGIFPREYTVYLLNKFANEEEAAV